MHSMVQFVADISLDSTDEVVQFPLLTHTIGQPPKTARKDLQTSESQKSIQPGTLESYLSHIGKYFNKDPTKWEQHGDLQVTVHERDGERITTKSGQFFGYELRLVLDMPYYQLQLPVRTDNPRLTFNVANKDIVTEEDWQELLREYPWTESYRQTRQLDFLQAKMEQEEDESLSVTGASGFWELSIDSKHHSSFDQNRVQCVIDGMKRQLRRVTTCLCYCLWGLSVTKQMRQYIVACNGISQLLTTANDTLNHQESEQDSMYEIQCAVFGTISVLMIDKQCRQPLLELEPGLNTLVTAMGVDGPEASKTAYRRTICSKLLCSMAQRDADIRISIVETGTLIKLIELMTSEGPGQNKVCFCIASIMACIVLDTLVMQKINDRKEMKLMFESCISLLDVTLTALKPENQTEGQDLELMTRLCEASGQAMWGAAHYCTLPDGDGVAPEYVSRLGQLGQDTLTNNIVELGRVAHCIAAALATLASSEVCADQMMVQDPQQAVMHTLLNMLTVVDHGKFKGSGHVRAAACCGIGFLSCHPIGAKGDDCLVGPYRDDLLRAGAMRGLLQCALTPMDLERCRPVIEQAAAVGIMYLSTHAGALDPIDLSLLSHLIASTSNVEMVEFLMAATWILLRVPENRTTMAQQFSENPGASEMPANDISGRFKSQMKDAIDVYDLSDELAGALKSAENAQNTQDQANQENVQESEEEAPKPPPTPSAGEAILEGTTNDEEIQPQTPAQQGPKTQIFKSDQENNEIEETTTEVQPNQQSEEAQALNLEEQPQPSSAGLQDNWGLDVLVQVGESWLQQLMQMTSDNVQPSLIKLAEFMVASVCLMLVEDGEAIPNRHAVLCVKSNSKGSNQESYWGIDGMRPEPEPLESDTLKRCITLLVNLLSVKLSIAWRVLQLSITSLWNASCRNQSIEMLVVTLGAVPHLLSIAGQAELPHSLRHVAIGYLSALYEWYPNTLSTPPIEQVVNVTIQLIDSKVPLLEHQACQALARFTYCSPLGQPNPRRHLCHVKEVTAKKGGIQACVGLLARCTKRYQIALAGYDLASAQQTELSGGESAVELNTVQSVVTTWKHCIATLLNLSVIESNQVTIARAGLSTLLGQQSFLDMIVFTKQHGTPEGAGERELLQLTSDLLRNLSLHKNNRSLLYRAELHGSAMVEKCYGQLNRTMSGGRLLGTTPKQLSPTPSRPSSPSQSIPGSPPGSPNSARTRLRRVQTQDSRNTLLPPVARARLQKERKFADDWNDIHVGSPVSTIGPKAAKLLSPKGLFEPVQDESELGIIQLDPLNAMGDQPAPEQVQVNLTHSSSIQDEESPDASMPLISLKNNTHKSVWRFLSWLDSTFEQSDKSKLTAQSSRHQEKKVDDQGYWIEDRYGTPILRHLLQRPVNALLCSSDGIKTRHGRNRWEPPISRYVQDTMPIEKLHIGAQPLLTTQMPEAEADLVNASKQMAAVGVTATSPRSSSINRGTEIQGRPGTANRGNGREPLTILTQFSAKDSKRQPAVTVVAPGNSADASPRSDRPATNSTPELFPLKLVLSPHRHRTVISFLDKLSVTQDPQKARMAVFKHVQGSRVHKGLFEPYTLPNGQKVFYYYSGGQVMDEVEILELQPPQRPTSVPQALQQGMPIADVLALIAKPPGSAPPYSPYKPVPHLVPLPSEHTLPVKRPDCKDQSAYGELREDCPQMTLFANIISKTETNTVREKIEIEEDIKVEWTLPMSCFKPRAKESDSKGFYDTEQVLQKQFELDWQRVVGKDKFTSMMSRENKAHKASTLSDEAVLQQCHDYIKEQYGLFLYTFINYSSMGSGSPYLMQLNSFTAFLEEAEVSDNDSQYVKRSDCDTVFIVANFVADKKAPENKVNDEHALMRYEFMEALIRLSIAKYGKGQQTFDVAEALQLLFTNCLAPRFSQAQINSNDFRKDRLYTEEVDQLLKSHSSILKALYSRYRLRPVGGGLRPKTLRMDGWHALLDDAGLLDAQFTQSDATICFIWSRMLVVDEVKDFDRYSALTFVDFMEALGRLADRKPLPSASDIDAAGYPSVFEWYLDKDTAGADEHNHIFQPRASFLNDNPNTRPLYSKLEILIDLILRKLYWDPSQPEMQYNYDACLKMIKKQDKDLGA